MSRFDEVMRRWDVLRFLRRRGFDTRLTETGEVHIKCPRCHDHKHRLYVNRRTKNWLCYNCSGKGRSAITFVQWLLDCDDARAQEAIIQTADLSAMVDDDVDDAPAKKEIVEEPLPPGYKPLVLPADRRSKPYWDYLVDRNITPTMVRDYGIGYCPRGDYRGRVILPIMIFGTRRGWVGRTIFDNVKRKYMNPSGVHTGQLLFNLDTVLTSGSQKVVLVEGPFDALRIPDVAVCTFGKKISNAQMHILTKAGFRQVVFCYDGDALGDSFQRENAFYHARRIPTYMHCYRAKLPPEYDPGNAPLRILSKAIEEAEPINLGD